MTDDSSTKPERGAEAPISNRDIRERAYDLWERNHRPEGFQIAFWLMAERELRAERLAGSKDPSSVG